MFLVLYIHMSLCLFEHVESVKRFVTRMILIIVFPYVVPVHRLDCLARVKLWESGLDYVHGTGHGVGSFLNVHEGSL